MNQFFILKHFYKRKHLLKIFRNYWKNFILFCFEIINFDFFFLRYQSQWTNYCVYSKKQLDIIKALSKKEPILFLSIHYGNWELLALFLSKNFSDLAAIYRPLDNSFLNKKLLQWRKTYSKNLIPKNKFYPKAFLHMKKGSPLLLLIDQFALSHQEKIFFLKKQTFVSKGIYYLIHRIEPRIILTHIERLDKNKRFHKIHFQIVSKNFIKKNKSSSQKTIQKLFNPYEKLIIKKPEEWNWLHRFWRK